MKNWRINLILIFIFIFAAAIVGRLVFLQIVNRGFYKALAHGQQSVSEEIMPSRGEIFFNDGKTRLAANYSLKSLHVNPAKIQDKEKISEILANILGLSENSILEKLKKENSSDEVLKAKLSDNEANGVKELKIDSAYISEEEKRFYPQGNLGAHVAGFVGGAGVGQYGLEEFYEDKLKGSPGILEGDKNSKGYLIFFGLEKYLEPQNGLDLILTIDYNIQFTAEKLLARAKEELDIEEGSILVADPNTGKILAMANFPSFNPNEYSNYKNLGVFQNGTVQKLYEPGSVFKPITMAAALNEEKITPVTTYEDKGVIKIGAYTILNYDGRIYGKDITMTEVLEKSINTGAVFAENQAGDDLFLKYVKNFGFFGKIGIDIHGEVASENKNLQDGKEINFTTASFGQGVAITPIQLVRAFSAIANGGKLIRPYIVDKFSGNGIVSANFPTQWYQGQVISSKTASALTAMLVSVVENGFSKKAKIPGYYIAGKTGTAQVPWTSLGQDKAGYSDKTIQSFIGFAPALNPKFLILVKLNNPKTKTAEYSAMPVFRELAKYIIDYMQIPPDHQN